jgi:dienelactone hydrolase
MALAVGLAITLVVAAACSGSSSPTAASSTQFTVAGSVVGQNQPSDSFYQTPNPLPPAPPGTIISSEKMDGAPDGAQAYRVLYHSTGISGADVAESGVVIVPAGPAPSSGRPVVSWGHPTTGVDDACAPSRSTLVFTILPGLTQLLQAGDVVAATDYEGLGTAGVHPYLVGESEGRSLLDAARAARNLPDAGATTSTVFWGWSQGGHAALFAGQLAPTYAPELQVKGVAAAAPAGELAALLQLSENTQEGVTLGGYAINAYANVYAPTTPGLDVGTVVTPAGQQVIPSLVPLCLLTQTQQITDLVTPVVGKFYAADPTNVAPWSQLLAQNVPGAVSTPAPIFIAQGTADTTVAPQTTQQLASELCAKGDYLQLKLYDGVTHDQIGFTSAPDVVTWLAQQLAGTPAQSNCDAVGTVPPSSATP